MFGKLLAVAAGAASLAGLPHAIAAAAQDRLQVFPFPHPIRDSHHNNDFTVRVGTPGGVRQGLYEYTFKVDM